MVSTANDNWRGQVLVVKTTPPTSSFANLTEEGNVTMSGQI